MSFKESVYTIQVIEFISIKLFIIFPYYAFTVCGICSDTPSFIPDSDNLGFFFSLIYFVRGSLLLLIFPRNNFWICDLL